LAKRGGGKINPTSYLKPYKKQIILGPFFKLLEALFELLLPLLMARLIDVGIANNNQSYIVKMGAAMLFIAVIGTASSFVCQYFASVAAQGYGTKLREVLFNKSLSLSFKSIDKWGVETLTNRITGDVRAVELGLAMSIRLLMRLPVIVTMSTVMILFINKGFVWILLISVSAFSLLLYIIMSKALPMYTKTLKSLDAIAKRIREYLFGVRVIKAFNKENAEQEKFNESNKKYMKDYQNFNLLTALSSPLTGLCLNAAIVAVLFLGRNHIKSDVLTKGELIACVNYFTQIIMALIVFTMLMPTLTRAGAGYKRVSEFLKYEDTKSLQSIDEKLDSEKIIECRNLSFSYSDSAALAIEDISFDLYKGQSMGIIGATGSAKSTLLYLICSFYEAKSGSVKTSEKDIAMVFQKPMLISGTVEDNVRMGDNCASAEEVENALKAAQCDFISEREHGIYSHVEAKGENFSGGQKQRISIARGLLKKPELLLLDDASSALDYLTEQRLRQSIKELNITTVTASVRVNSVKNCDVILVLKNGKCEGIGTHAELLETCHEYTEIYESQR